LGISVDDPAIDLAWLQLFYPHEDIPVNKGFFAAEVGLSQKFVP
jgi:hypothetical protein